MERADWLIEGANLVDVFSLKTEKRDIWIKRGRFCAPKDSAEKTIPAEGLYIAPGFIDAHIHIESSMMTPSTFARAVLPHGTTSVIADPHEIVNVSGSLGLRFMIQDGKRTPLSFYWTLPSCVPAAGGLETSGAELDADHIMELLDSGDFVALGEVMNYPGLINGLDDIRRKVEAAINRGLSVDGHAPMLRGRELMEYVSHGVSTDHECIDIEEAREKISLGMKIMIREGTTSKNLADLKELFSPLYLPMIMLVSDDLDASDIEEEGHLDRLLTRCIREGIPLEYAVRAMSYNPALHYGLRWHGAVAPGYIADCVLFAIEDKEVKIHWVFKDGVPVWSREKGYLLDFRGETPFDELLFSMNLDPVTEGDLYIPSRKATASVIGVIEDQIITEHLKMPIDQEGEYFRPDLERDILPIVVLERHKRSGNIGRALIHGLGIKRGAIATTVAHDSHNVICTGADYRDMARCINTLIEMGGGLVVSIDDRVVAKLPLFVGGIMSNESPEKIAEALREVHRAAQRTGATIKNPFMKLSFMSLAVIPSLKVTDLGLVDSERFETRGIYDE